MACVEYFLRWLDINYIKCVMRTFRLIFAFIGVIHIVVISVLAWLLRHLIALSNFFLFMGPTTFLGICIIFVIYCVEQSTAREGNIFKLIMFMLASECLIMIELYIIISIWDGFHDTECFPQVTLQEAYNNTHEQKVVDSFQRSFECCGLYNYTYFPNCSYPPSCCREGKPSCEVTEVYNIGCSQALADSMTHYVIALALTSVPMILVLIFGNLVAVCMIIVLK